MCLIYLDSDAWLQVCHFHRCVCVCVCPPITDKVPHFSRLGDVEVNAGQNASFQCVATGKVSEIEPFLLEVRQVVFVLSLLEKSSHHFHISTCIIEWDCKIAGRRRKTKDKKRKTFYMFGI